MGRQAGGRPEARSFQVVVLRQQRIMSSDAMEIMVQVSVVVVMVADVNYEGQQAHGTTRVEITFPPMTSICQHVHRVARISL